MDQFDISKKNALDKEDKSSKGSWDEKIIPLCDTINSKNDYYTTSSCAGRIVLIKTPDSGKKQESTWLFVSHGIVKTEMLLDSLKEIPKDGLWFRYESFIIHIVCRKFEDARSLLTVVRDLGFKRAGIISIGKKITVEIIGNEKIDTIISNDGKILVGEDYLTILVDLANDALQQNWQNIKRLDSELKKL